MTLTKYERNKKWRKNKPKIWKKIKDRYYKKSEATAFNSKQLWTIYDCNLILMMSFSDSKIARMIGRSVKAIQVQRTRLKKKIRKELNV